MAHLGFDIRQALIMERMTGVIHFVANIIGYHWQKSENRDCEIFD